MLKANCDLSEEMYLNSHVNNEKLLALIKELDGLDSDIAIFHLLKAKDLIERFSKVSSDNPQLVSLLKGNLPSFQ